MRIGIAFSALLAAAGCDTEARTIDEALNAYSQNRITVAEQAFRKIAAEPGAAPADRATAHRELARIAWLIDGDAEKALASLREADRVGEQRCATAALVARVLDEAERDAELVAQAGELASRCDEAAEGDSIRLQAAEAATDLAVRGPAESQRHLAAAHGFVEWMAGESRTSLEAAALRLRLALLRRDAAAAIAGWKDYFWLAETDMPDGLRPAVPAARPLFDAGLADNADADSRLALVDLLIRAGFAEAAEHFAASTGLSRDASGHPSWIKSRAYLDGRRTLESALIASNRAVARGGDAADLEAAVARFTASLMAAARQSGDARPALRNAYGLHWQVGETDGHDSVHMGHVVQNERRLIEQYGHRARAGFLVLDNMIANGFNSWLWDGSAAAGGWTEPDQTIVQVRQGYTSNPLSAWELHRGGPSRRRLLADQPKLAAADLEALAQAEVAYLPGLAGRLRLQAADQVGARVRASGDGGDLRRAFLDEYWRATFQHSMLAHEGRHALDRKLVTGLARLRDSNLEYRAKLSELAFADYPRLALFNIDDRTIGSGNAHGKANERILLAYSEWIAANRSQVRGYDPRLPAMVQIDRLTDEQIRSIARSLDPLARGR